MARQAAEARLKAALKQAASDGKRLALAEDTYGKGDLEVASRIYVSLALSKPKRDATEKAKQRLRQLAAEARQRLGEVDDTLRLEQTSLSPGELFDNTSAENRGVVDWQRRVTSAFERYDALLEQYADVPGIGPEIRGHVRKQRLRPECAVVLNEPRALALWELGQQHEANDQGCCAYWVYREARELAPALSARRAEERLAAMEKEPKIVAAAEACRNLQECHRLYERAERLEALRPDRARELYAEIASRTPDDSPLCQASRKRMAELAP
jgi:hypothetical protein